MIRFRLLIPSCSSFLLLIVLAACSTEATQYVDIESVLPEGAVAEITHAYPEFQAKLVVESESHIRVGERFLEVEGIEDHEVASRLAEFVASYLNDPEKKENQKRAREEYEALSPRDKMIDLVERITDRHPEFSYKWVSAEEGNTRIVYGDNGLVLNGIESEGEREEWAHALWKIQEQIDAETTGEQE